MKYILSFLLLYSLPFYIYSQSEIEVIEHQRDSLLQILEAIPPNDTAQFMVLDEIAKIEYHAEDLALVPFLKKADAAILPKALRFENNQKQWQLDVMSALKSRGYQLQQQTRMNYIFTRKLSDVKP